MPPFCVFPTHTFLLAQPILSEEISIKQLQDSKFRDWREKEFNTFWKGEKGEKTSIWEDLTSARAL